MGGRNSSDKGKEKVNPVINKIYLNPFSVHNSDENESALITKLIKTLQASESEKKALMEALISSQAEVKKLKASARQRKIRDKLKEIDKILSSDEKKKSNKENIFQTTVTTPTNLSTIKTESTRRLPIVVLGSPKKVSTHNTQPPIVAESLALEMTEEST